MLGPAGRYARHAELALLVKETDSCTQNDLLMWAIEDIERRPDLRENAEKFLVQTVMVSNFAAIHSSSIVCPST